MRLRLATFGVLVPGMVIFLVGLYRGSGVVWVGFALLGVASLLALWIKWGLAGWGWKERRERRR